MSKQHDWRVDGSIKYRKNIGLITQDTERRKMFSLAKCSQLAVECTADLKSENVSNSH